MTDGRRPAGDNPAAISRRQGIAAGLAAGVAALAPARAGSAAPKSAPARPNIVLIVCDDLATSLYDTVRPLRDLLERTGLRFTNYVAAVPSCAPSRAAMLTGRYPQNTGVFTNTAPHGGWRAFAGEDNELVSLGVRLQFAGYRTGLIGKYINDYETTRPSWVPRGWDAWHAWAGGGKYDGYVVNDGGVLSTRTVAADPANYETDWYAARAIDFIGGPDGKPFFLYLAPHAPHMPALPAARHQNAGGDVVGPRTPAVGEQDAADKPRWIRNLKRFGRPAQRQSDLRFRDQYRTMLSVADMVRDLVAALGRNGQLDNTYLIFTSDNGQFYGEHRIPSGKGSLYEEGIRVPLVVRGPGIRRGTSDLLVNGIDLLPTILDLARSAYGDIDGRSFAAALSGRAPQNWRGACFVRYGLAPARVPAPSADVAAPDHVSSQSGGNDDDEDGSGRDGGGGILGLRGHDWSYIRSLRTAEEEFYDLGADPWQLANGWDDLPSATRSALRTSLNTLAACRSDECHAAENRVPTTVSALRSIAATTTAATLA